MPEHSRTVDVVDPARRSRERRETRRHLGTVSLLLLLVLLCCGRVKAQVAMTPPPAVGAAENGPTTGSGMSTGVPAIGSAINQGTASSAEDSLSLGSSRTAGTPIVLTAPQIFAI